MDSSITTALQICFVCCHPGPAEPFASFSKALQEKKVECQLLATETAYQTIQRRKVTVHDFRDPSNTTPLAKLDDKEADKLAEKVAESVSVAKCVITDVGSAFSARVQKILS